MLAHHNVRRIGIDVVEPVTTAAGSAPVKAATATAPAAPAPQPQNGKRPNA